MSVVVVAVVGWRGRGRGRGEGKTGMLLGFANCAGMRTGSGVGGLWLTLFGPVKGRGWSGVKDGGG